MKQSRINPISDKKKKILAREEVTMLSLLTDCKGLCMVCGTFAPLEKSHNRKRDKFIIICRDCHQPLGVHRYYEEEIEK